MVPQPDSAYVGTCKAPSGSPLAELVSPGVPLSFSQYTGTNMSRTERYSSHLRCGNGYELRFTRLTRLKPNCPDESSDCIQDFDTLLRVRGPESDSYTEPLLLVDAPSASNAGFACVVTNGSTTTFRMFGGAFVDKAQENGRLDYAEGLVSMVNHTTAQLEWMRPRKRLWNYTQATLLNCASGKNAVCELDGKISLARFRGRTLMFVRENPSPAGGSRHVQVSSSDDGIGDWSSFRRLEFDGLHKVPHKENNIYFLTVRPFQLADGTEGLLGLMPANLNFTHHAHNLTSDTGWKQARGGGLYASVSLGRYAGHRWSRPQKLIESDTADNYRTNDHPVDIVGAEPDEPLTHLLVDQGVCERPLAAECPADATTTCRYDIGHQFIPELVRLARNGRRRRRRRRRGHAGPPLEIMPTYHPDLSKYF